MVYANKLVAVVKVNGQVLRETDGSVIIPFGSEYSVLIKNLNSCRAKVKVSIDGKEATSDTWLIVEPNSSVELERFISNGNLESGNRFKFIERTSDIEKHRGIEAEDGLVRIEYAFEKIDRVEHIDVVYDYYCRPKYPPVLPKPRFPWRRPSPIICRSSPAAMRASLPTGQRSGLRSSVRSSAVSRDGITVPGSISNQKFTTGAYFPVHESEVLVLKLRGTVAGKKAKKAITTKSKTSCQTCGEVSKSGIEFCSKCGTSLQVI